MANTFVITVYSAERYRSDGSAVVDALSARGYDAEIVTGPNARDALGRVHADQRDRLRVLLVPADLPGAKLEALHRGLDPAGRGDLLILKTSRTAWELGQTIADFERQLRRRRVARATGAHTAPRPVLPRTPTRPLLPEVPPATVRPAAPHAPTFSSVLPRRRPGRRVMVGVAAAVGATAITWAVLAFGTAPSEPTPAEPAPALVAARVAPAAEPEEVRDPPSPALQERAPAPEATPAPAEPEEVIEIEDGSAETHPAEAPGTKPVVRRHRRPRPDRRLAPAEIRPPAAAPAEGDATKEPGPSPDAPATSRGEPEVTAVSAEPEAIAPEPTPEAVPRPGTVEPPAERPERPDLEGLPEVPLEE